MIDVRTETLFPLDEAPEHIPLHRRGRKVHKHTPRRWMSQGIRGIRLEAIKIGGSWHTSTEALHRFFRALSVAADPSHEAAHVPPEDLLARDRRARQELAAMTRSA